ncbi:MAG: hypothetical protein H6819_06365 [Phycisphaerales bacterium]|nr:hypothetical protein [Phycisphaerales bacterium]MCB9858555.1 hypothetical protein [Phycisphaerales bacterium]
MRMRPLRMMPRRFAATLVAFVLCATTSGDSRVRAQSTEATPPASKATDVVAKPSDALADRQAIIGDRVKRLEDRMFQLAQALKKSDPEKAARLVEGLAALREDGLSQNIGDVVRMLREKQLADATDAQATVEAQMQMILKLLMEETNDLDKQREELKRLEEIRKELDVLLSKQKETKASAERTDAQKRLADAMEDAANAARDLLNRQEGLNAERGSGGENGARPADAQAALRGETEALAREVAELAEQLRAAGAAQDAASPKADEAHESPADKKAADGAESSGAKSDTPSGESSSESGEGSPMGVKSPAATGDSKSGGEPADDAVPKEASEATSSDREPAERAEDAKAHLDRAADAMQAAEQALRAAESAGSEGDQATAAEELRKAAEALKAEAADIRNKLKLEDVAEKQRELAEDASNLLDDMRGESGEKDGAGEQSDESAEKSEEGNESSEGGGEQSGGGASKPGQQGGSQQSPPASPGERPLEEAIPHQQDAAKNLEDNLPIEAVEDQQKAIEKLEQAKEDLEERLDQLRREQQEQLLAALESRFRAMLSRQLEVNKATDRLIDLGVEHWKRSDQLEVAELSEKQRWVGDEADEAMFLLTEEGSTVVLPPLLEEVRDDAREVADRLAAAQADRGVRTLQDELESILRDMIDAVKKQQEELEQGGGGGGGGDGSPPLLPGSAELKLLRSCQLRINNATESLHAELSDSSESAEAIQAAIERLSVKQSKVADMAKSMHESLQKAQ